MGNSPNWSYGYIPTPAQWNQWFAAKQDDLGVSQAMLIALRAGANTPNGFVTLDSAGLLGKALLKIATGTFTLTPNAASTVVSVTGATLTSVFTGAPVPLTPDAANDAPWSSYVMGVGQFTVTHANNARADRTFSYCIFL